MIGLLQRVTEAEVIIKGETTAAIGPGLMVLIGIEQGDGERQVQRLADRILGYRVFGDAEGRMNLSLTDSGGDLLLVPQFTRPPVPPKVNACFNSWRTLSKREARQSNADDSAPTCTSSSSTTVLSRSGCR